MFVFGGNPPGSTKEKAVQKAEFVSKFRFSASKIPRNCFDLLKRTLL
jgi:hypothetical protein